MTSSIVVKKSTRSGRSGVAQQSGAGDQWGFAVRRRHALGPDKRRCCADERRLRPKATAVGFAPSRPRRSGKRQSVAATDDGPNERCSLPIIDA
jgi:hypothetical protein